MINYLNRTYSSNYQRAVQFPYAFEPTLVFSHNVYTYSLHSHLISRDKRPYKVSFECSEENHFAKACR